MRSEDAAYMARVNVAVWLIRKAGKIARRLNGTTPEQRQAVEDEIVAIGQRMYDEMRQVVEDEIAAVGREMYGDTRQQSQPEVTHDPGGDHELEAYIAAVRDLAPDAERLIFERYQDPRLSPAELAERWQAFRKELEECRKQ